MNIIFAGSGEFGLPALGAILAAGHRVPLVVSQPDKPAGRGKTLTPTPIAQFALENSLPLVRTANINSEPLPAADVMVVIAFGQKIAEAITNHPRLGSVNLHASLLPKYRGAAPINWAILSGQTVTGNSVIRLAQKMDAGAVLGQSMLDIRPGETAGELHDRLADDGGPLITQVLDSLADGTAVELPQDDRQATAAPKLSREMARVDWSRPAGEVARRICGLFPWPGCRVALLDAQVQQAARLTLARATVSTAGQAEPGTISDWGTICCGDGLAVQILELQPEGKKPMSLAAYRNGHPWSAGMRLQSL